MLSELVEFFDGPMLALWGPFFVLLLCAFGLPIPEDIVLITAGFLAGKNGSPITPVLIVTYAGIMIGDSIIFCLGRKFGPKIINTRFGKWALSEKNRARAQEAFEKYGSWVEKKNYGRTYMGIDRSTFLIDSDGKVREIWRNVRVAGHVEKVLEQAQALNG